MATKTNFDNDQVERLKVWFDINPTPSRNQVDHISSQLQVMSAHVWMWFHQQQNRVKAKPYISPQKVKTASLSKGLSSSMPHAHKAKTGSLSKQLDCTYGNAHKNRDVQEHVKGAEDRRKDRVQARKGHIRGILRKQDTRQHSDARSAEGCFNRTVESAETRGRMRVNFKDGGDVGMVNGSEVMQRLEPMQGCIKRKDKVADSVEHKRTRSSPGDVGIKHKIGNPQESSATKLQKDSIHRERKEAESHQYIRRKPAQGSMTRIVKEVDTRKSMRKKLVSRSEKKILKEADSQNFLVVKPVLRGIERRDKVADSRERGGLKATQGGINTAKKVSEKKRSLLQSECLLKQNQLTHKVKNTVVPKKMDATSNISQVGYQRAIEPEGTRQRGVTSTPVSINRTVEVERKHERQIKGPVTRRKVPEVLGSLVNEHHRAAEKNLRNLNHCRPVVEVSSSSIHKKKCKDSSRKGKKIKMLLSQKPNPLMNEAKTGNVLKESGGCEEKSKLKCKMPARTSTGRTGLFSALSLPQGKANISLSDSSDAEDFQDDQNKRTHKLTKKKKDMTDALGNSKSIPVLSRKRQHSALADCANRMTDGRNLTRIPLKSSSQVHQDNKKNLPVSPVKCDVSSTSTSQSSVVSSTVEEISALQNHRHKRRPLSPDSPDKNSCEIDIRITKRLLQGKNSEEMNSGKEVGKRCDPVISDDKIWDPYSGNFLFKRELSVNLIKINLSSYSDRREVTVSSKMNSTRRHKENKDSNPLCIDDKTDINANVSVKLSSVPKAAEKSIWSSIASSVETSNKVWSSIASPTETSLKEIPFIDGSSLQDQESNKLWSSIASSAEKSTKDIPFMERPASPDGESTPSSSQDTLASNEDPNRGNTESIFEDDSCEVSSSVDLEKVPADLSGEVEGIEETFSAVVKESKENEKISGYAMENTEDKEKSPEEEAETMTEVEQTSADELEDMEVNKEKYQNASDNLMESEEEFEETPVVLMEFMEEAEKSPADFVENCEANKGPVERERSTEDVERTGADSGETPLEVDKISEELMKRTKSSCGKEEEEKEISEKPATECQDLYENIDSPYYDICSPYMVVDEVSCSDTEEIEPKMTASQEDSSVSTHSSSKLESPSSKVVKNAETSEVSELDLRDDEEIVVSCSDTEETEPNMTASPEDSTVITHSLSKPESPSPQVVKNAETSEVSELDISDDEEIVVSSLPPKKTRKESPGNKVSKDQSVGKGISAGAFKPSASSPTNPTSSKATKKKDSPKVVDFDCCSETDEVILMSTVAPSTPSSKDFMNGTPDLSKKGSEKGSPKSLQIDAPATSVNQVLPIALENVTLLHTPSVRDSLSESQGVSDSTEEKSNDPVDMNTTPDADMELDCNDIELDMICDDIKLDIICENVSTISNDCDDHKLSERLLATSKQDVGRNDSSSDELVIDMEPCDQMDQPLQDQNVSENTSGSLRDSEDVSLDPPGWSVDCNDSSSDELVIDMEAYDLMKYPPQEQDVPEETSASQGDPAVDSAEDDVKLDNYQASDELNSCCDADTSLNAAEDLKSDELDEAEQSVEDGDSVHVIDVNACGEVESPLHAMDALENDAVVVAGTDSSQENNELRDSTSDGLCSDEITCEQKECSLAGNDPAGINTTTSRSDASEEKWDSVKLTVVHEDSTSDELVIDMEACDLMKCPPKYPAQEQDAQEDVSASPGDPAVDLSEVSASPGDPAVDLSEDDVKHDNSQTSDEVNSYCDADTSLNAAEDLTSDELDEAERNAEHDASEEMLDPVKQTMVHEGSPSEDELFKDATTCDPVESPLEDNAFTENSVNTSLDSFIASKANTPAYGAESSSSVTCVMDQGSLEEGLMTSGGNPPLEEESFGNVGAVLGEVEDLVPARGSAPSSDDSVPCETKVHADRKGSPSVKAGTTTTELSEVFEAGDLAVTAINSSATSEDHQPQTSSSSDAANLWPAKTDIKVRSEPGVAAEKDTLSGTNTPSGDLKPSNKENSAEKVKHPRSLSKLVLDLTQKLGILARKASVGSLDLPKSTVSINHKARYSKKSSSLSSSLSSSSTEAAPQPSKPIQEPRRGSKRRRVITNTNLKRPPIPEAVQIRIQQLNPYPCDHNWKRNAAMVELAQKELQLDCQPGDISFTKALNLAANLELSNEPLMGARGNTMGSLNFYYQPDMDPTNAVSAGATVKDSCGATVATSNENSCSQRVDAQPSSGSMDSGWSTTVEDHPLVRQLLCGTEPVKQKRSRSKSGKLNKDNKSRRRRKSSDDIPWDGSFSEKDIREEWMQLLKVMEESTLSGDEGQPSSSGTTVPSSSVTASASEGDLGSSAVVSVEGLPSAPLRVTASASTMASAEDQFPAATGYQAATLGVPETSTASASEADDLSDMPSILRVFSLRDEAQESCPTLEPSGLGSFDLDSARIVEEQRTPSEVYSLAATAAAASAARNALNTTHPASSLPSYQQAQSWNRKRHSSQTYGSTDGVPPVKSAARAVNGSTFQEFPGRTMQQRQIRPQPVPSSCRNQSGNLSGTVQTIASNNNIINSTSSSVPSGISPNNHLINIPMASPSSSNTQGATCVQSASPILVASQPPVSLVPVPPVAQRQVQQPLLQSLLNPLILNQELQQRRFSDSPPLCTPYPITTVSANVISGHPGVTLNSLPRQPVPAGNIPGPVIGYLARNVTLPTPANTQWTQPSTSLQLTPVNSQTYSNDLNNQSKTIYYTAQGSTLTFHV
ncbi:uncharacterized protein LOC100888674 [Strongylocentrotus purpuratus]|uniref:Homeobox domain-containing protein n=1 Tax=Strongylocentrotus purpuratus TaxID=7668 RepID=A0A7M7HI56_STRPU|nr:uncharacterized protein LOC100888674 [Strongylocentrotus purpuratus]XP_011660973.2 uncharacterized protein LOC100888674 [Strongylocentrotus purpuratus]XP_011660974.2 uncharacterized protein LOC100888674 [Strongylocentrotus purpuratus]